MIMFTYNIITLIELVESRPCIWDKTLEIFKDKIMKKEAWNEIYRFLEEKYDDLSIDEQKEVGEKITTKWVNIKDAYYRSLKKKQRKGTKKTYVYGPHLHFLLKFNKGDNTDHFSNFETIELNIKHDNTDTDRTTSDLSSNDDYDESFLQSPKPKKSKKGASNLDTVDIQVLDELKRKNEYETSQMSTSHEEEQFFQSFIPYIKDMSEEEKIDLQMDILSCIKKIKRNRSRNRLTY